MKQFEAFLDKQAMGLLDVGEPGIPGDYLRDYQLLKLGVRFDAMDMSAVELDWLLAIDGTLAEFHQKHKG